MCTRRCPGSNKQREKVFLLFTNTIFIVREGHEDRWIGKYFNEEEIPADRSAWNIWILKDYFRKLFYTVLFQCNCKIKCRIRNMYFQHRKLSRCTFCVHLGKITISHSNKQLTEAMMADPCNSDQNRNQEIKSSLRFCLRTQTSPLCILSS